ncbi:clavesin-1-like isoform X2 [Centruroides sculpturatus]|uniref:clavesin-1-like isoform X2 n=1 Tax=Centruroides sculpturatus TaxID=218467 RepID=UPI000C6CF4A1|nr:clavesin-1-like isoform X2 [Centruroides sculpturatus]
MEPKKEYTWNEKELEEFRMAVIKEGLKCRTDDIFLLSFLRARKCDRERALKLLKNYYAIRKKYTDVFKDLRPSALETYLQMDIMCSKRLETGQVLGLGRANHWDPTKVKPIDIVKCIILLMDMEVNDHPMQVNGVYALIDAKTVSWRHAIQFTPRVLYLILSCFFQCAPILHKGVHIVNVNKCIHAIIAMAYPFLPYKIKQRIHFHGSNMKDLHKEIDPKYLPAEFGGELPPFDSTETKQRLRDLEEFFVENEKYWTEDKNN